MDINTKTLTKEWIDYLRNNQIITHQSDPSGQLEYKKKITTDIISRFCKLKTDFDEQVINDAIQKVISKKTGIAQEPDQEQSREKSASGAFGQMSQHLGTQTQPPTPTNEATTLSQSPDAIRKREQRARAAQSSNAFGQMSQQLGGDTQQPTTNPKAKPGANAFSQMSQQLGNANKSLPKTVEFNEKDIELLFNILTASSPAAKPSAPSPAADNNSPPQQPDTEEDKQNKIKRLKRLVRNEMTPQQRKSLWNALNESTLHESQIEPTDINAVFKDAYKLRNASTSGFKGALNTGLGKINKGLRKDKIELSDLQQAWKDAGYPDDTKDIETLLTSQGFGPSEIKKIFSSTFGDNIDHEQESVSSPASIKIANYVITNGLKDDLVAFMQQEFGEELGITTNHGLIGKAANFIRRKATTEEVRQIFTTIINEERTERFTLIKEQEKKLLGRNRR